MNSVGTGRCGRREYHPTNATRAWTVAVPHHHCHHHYQHTRPWVLSNAYQQSDPTQRIPGHCSFVSTKPQRVSTAPRYGFMHAIQKRTFGGFGSAAAACPSSPAALRFFLPPMTAVTLMPSSSTISASLLPSSLQKHSTHSKHRMSSAARLICSEWYALNIDKAAIRLTLASHGQNLVSGTANIGNISARTRVGHSCWPAGSGCR